MTEADKCPLCQTPAESREIDISRGISEWRCRRCGHFISPPGDARSYEHLVEVIHLLSGLARELTERGQTLRISSWHQEKINELLSGRVPKTVQKKVDRFLRRLGDKSDHPGAEVELKGWNDLSLAYAKNPKELNSYLKHLRESGWIESNGNHHTVTVKGWDRIEKLKESRATSTKAFVAMSFDKEDKRLAGLYKNAIAPAIKAAGYEPLLVKLEHHNEKICDRIIADIRRCRFMVADFTQQRQNVYFEAGFAKGLGMEVIWLCNKEEMDQKLPHFDTRQYNHIVWEQAKLADLQQALTDRIEATIGRGPASLLTDKLRRPNPV